MDGSKGASWRLHPLRVRYQETDRMGVVYHANYINWFEIGRTEWIRAAGVSYESIEASGLLLPVTELDCEFLQPAKYDDTLLICTRIASLSPIRMAFASEVRHVGEADWERCAKTGGSSAAEPPGSLLVRGGTRHVWVNRDWKPVRLDRAAPGVYALLEKLGGSG